MKIVLFSFHATTYLKTADDKTVIKTLTVLWFRLEVIVTVVVIEVIENFMLSYFINENYTSDIISVRINIYKSYVILETNLNHVFDHTIYLFLLIFFVEDVIIVCANLVVTLEMNHVHVIDVNNLAVVLNVFHLLDQIVETVVVIKRRIRIRTRVISLTKDVFVVLDVNISILINTNRVSFFS